MRILVVEDDEFVRSALKKGLEAQFFAVDTADNGERGAFLAKNGNYDLLVLDYILPGKNGKQICEETRKSGKTMPILLLSVQSGVEDKVEALNLGADDYLVKPFDYNELIARVRALLRRPEEMTANVLAFDDLSLNTRTQKVTRGKEEIYLTRKEFMLLEFLLRHQGCVATRSMLIDHVWDSSVDTFSNTIESHILSLRRKIERSTRKKIIQTVPGRGYKIDTKR